MEDVIVEGRCLLCPIFYSDFKKMCDHIRFHLLYPKYVCKMCNNLFICSADATEHELQTTHRKFGRFKPQNITLTYWISNMARYNFARAYENDQSRLEAAERLRLLEASLLEGTSLSEIQRIQLGELMEAVQAMEEPSSSDEEDEMVVDGARSASPVMSSATPPVPVEGVTSSSATQGVTVTSGSQDQIEDASERSPDVTQQVHVDVEYSRPELSCHSETGPSTSRTSALITADALLQSEAEPSYRRHILGTPDTPPTSDLSGNEGDASAPIDSGGFEDRNVSVGEDPSNRLDPDTYPTPPVDPGPEMSSMETEEASTSEEAPRLALCTTQTDPTVDTADVEYPRSASCGMVPSLQLEIDSVVSTSNQGQHSSPMPRQSTFYRRSRTTGPKFGCTLCPYYGTVITTKSHCSDVHHISKPVMGEHYYSTFLYVCLRCSIYASPSYNNVHAHLRNRHRRPSVRKNTDYAVQSISKEDSIRLSREVSYTRRPLHHTDFNGVVSGSGSSVTADENGRGDADEAIRNFMAQFQGSQDPDAEKRDVAASQGSAYTPPRSNFIPPSHALPQGTESVPQRTHTVAQSTDTTPIRASTPPETPAADRSSHSDGGSDHAVEGITFENIENVIRIPEDDQVSQQSSPDAANVDRSPLQQLLDTPIQQDAIEFETAESAELSPPLSGTAFEQPPVPFTAHRAQILLEGGDADPAAPVAVKAEELMLSTNLSNVGDHTEDRSSASEVYRDPVSGESPLPRTVDSTHESPPLLSDERQLHPPTQPPTPTVEDISPPVSRVSNYATQQPLQNNTPFSSILLEPNTQQPVDYSNSMNANLRPPANQQIPNEQCMWPSTSTPMRPPYVNYNNITNMHSVACSPVPNSSINLRQSPHVGQPPHQQAPQMNLGASPGPVLNAAAGAQVLLPPAQLANQQAELHRQQLAYQQQQLMLMHQFPNQQAEIRRQQLVYQTQLRQPLANQQAQLGHPGFVDPRLMQYSAPGAVSMPRWMNHGQSQVPPQLGSLGGQQFNCQQAVQAVQPQGQRFVQPQVVQAPQRLAPNQHQAAQRVHRLPNPQMQHLPPQASRYPQDIQRLQPHQPMASSPERGSEVVHRAIARQQIRPPGVDSPPPPHEQPTPQPQQQAPLVVLQQQQQPPPQQQKPPTRQPHPTQQPPPPPQQPSIIRQTPPDDRLLEDHRAFVTVRCLRCQPLDVRGDRDTMRQHFREAHSILEPRKNRHFEVVRETVSID